ncbi:hypothetical protein DAMDJJ_19515 [Cupriavidus necator]
MWTREKRDKFGKRGAPKESLRWIEGYERIAEMAAELPGTRLVYVADREANLMALLLRAQELDTPADWLYMLRTIVACRTARSCGSVLVVASPLARLLSRWDRGTA